VNRILPKYELYKPHAQKPKWGERRKHGGDHKKHSFAKKRKKLSKKEMSELLDSLERVKAALCDAYTGFNNTLSRNS
jgi:hypothetical protein